MTDTHNIDIPQAMIDAARDEWRMHDAIVHEDEGGKWWWICGCGAESGCILGADECVEDANRHEFGAVLAAAFAECEVRVETRAVRPYVTPWIVTTNGRLSHERRLVITTPAVVVTPAQEEPDDA